MPASAISLPMQRQASRLAIALAIAMAAPSWADSPPAPEHAARAQAAPFEMRVLATGLANPHNMVLGPDGHLWLTELLGRRILRVDTSTGGVTVLANVSDAVHTRTSSGEGQDGLLGIALHPDLLQGKDRDYVFVSLTYAAGRGGEFPNATAIRRYTYDRASGQLVSPVDILAGLPSSHDHQSARLLFGPDGALYYSIGDQGANQRAYLCTPNLAQALPTAAQVAGRDWSRYAGKVLRLNLDGSIPADNPVIRGVRSHIYAWGWRNPQGMVFAPDGKLFAADHGPNSDDELNLVLPGRNYGWPHVSGRKDDAAYAYANFSAARGGCAGIAAAARGGQAVPPDVPVARESEWSDPDYAEPLKTFFTVPTGHDFRHPLCAAGGLYFTCWPSIAPSSVAYYPAGGAAPGWGPSLLLASLKRGMIYRVPLDAATGLPAGSAQPVLRTQNRYREVVAARDGRTLYVATDSVGLTTSDEGRATSALAHPGAILVFRYTPQPPAR